MIAMIAMRIITTTKIILVGRDTESPISSATVNREKRKVNGPLDPARTLRKDAHHKRQKEKEIQTFFSFAICSTSLNGPFRSF